MRVLEWEGGGVGEGVCGWLTGAAFASQPVWTGKSCAPRAAPALALNC